MWLANNISQIASDKDLIFYHGCLQANTVAQHYFIFKRIWKIFLKTFIHYTLLKAK